MDFLEKGSESPPAQGWEGTVRAHVHPTLGDLLESVWGGAGLSLLRTAWWGVLRAVGLGRSGPGRAALFQFEDIRGCDGAGKSRLHGESLSSGV